MTLEGETRFHLKDGLILYTIGAFNKLVFISAKNIADERFMICPPRYTTFTFPEEFVEAILE